MDNITIINIIDYNKICTCRQSLGIHTTHIVRYIYKLHCWRNCTWPINLDQYLLYTEKPLYFAPHLIGDFRELIKIPKFNGRENYRKYVKLSCLTKKREIKWSRICASHQNAKINGRKILWFYKITVPALDEHDLIQS